MKKTIKRRDFLKTTTLVAAAAGFTGESLAFPHIVPSSALGLNGSVPPSDRVTMGFIGVGSMGQEYMRAFLDQPDVQVLAVCDPNRWRKEQAQHTVNGWYDKQVCASYVDFRELVARNDIDAVCIASPDSWHVLHALAAVRAGKDLCCAKPLGMSIDEIKLLREETNKRGRIFQFVRLMRTEPKFRFACELVRNGRIGKLQTIKVGVHSGAFTGEHWPKGSNERSGVAKVVPEPVPDWLDYEMWLGPASQTPYTTARLTYPHWFHISDYSLGYVAGWAIHPIDIAQWGHGTEETTPVEVSGTAVWPHDEALCDNPTSWDVNYVFADGVKMRCTGSSPTFQGERHGVTFEGTEGKIFAKWGNILEAEPKSLLDTKIGPNEIHLQVIDSYEKNFIECVKSRGRPICPIDVAVCDDEICQLGWIAFKLEGRNLKWDPEKEIFPNDPDANRLMKRTLRSPWRYEE